jgi:hypothetical protein
MVLNRDQKILKIKLGTLFWTTWLLCFFAIKRFANSDTYYGDVRYILSMGSFLVSGVFTAVINTYLPKYVGIIIILSIAIAIILAFK